MSQEAEEEPEGEELQDIAVKLVETGVKLVGKLMESTLGSVGGLSPLTKTEEEK